VPSTGEIGYIHIVSESSISAGMRRIEAVTGRRFGEDFRAEQQTVKTLCRAFKAPLDKVPEQASLMAEKIKALEKEISALRQKNALANLDDLIRSAGSAGGVRFIKEYLKEGDRESMQAKAEALAAKMGSGVAALFGVDNGKGVIMVAVSQDLISGKKLSAGAILKALCEAAGGKGGGRPNLAQGGAKDIASLENVFSRAEEVAGGVIR
jgi:alanyl-tRNA synthetase